MKASDYRTSLKELMDICMLCNDSGLAYNEVGVVITLMCLASANYAVFSDLR